MLQDSRPKGKRLSPFQHDLHEIAHFGVLFPPFAAYAFAEVMGK